MPKPRVTTDYGLPRLTLDEAARVLGTTPDALMAWIMVTVKPTPQQRTNWKASALPEALIRKYLTTRTANGATALRAAPARAPAMPRARPRRSSARRRTS